MNESGGGPEGDDRLGTADDSRIRRELIPVRWVSGRRGATFASDRAFYEYAP